MRRKTFEIPGAEHKAPIPSAAQVGNILWSSALLGTDPSTGTLPDGADKEIAQLFRNADTILEQAGLGRDDIVYVSVLLGDNGHRELINRHWLHWFPREDDRPARHITLSAPAGGAAAQLQFVAVAR